MAALKAKFEKSLLEQGHIEIIIGLASNMFYGADDPACILMLQTKSEPKESVLIIDAEDELEALLIKEGFEV